MIIFYLYYLHALKLTVPNFTTHTVPIDYNSTSWNIAIYSKQCMGKRESGQKLMKSPTRKKPRRNEKELPNEKNGRKERYV